MPRRKTVRATNTSAQSTLKFPFQLLPLFLAAFLLWAPGIIRGQSSASLTPGTKPADIPQAWKPWIGDYGTDEVSFTVGESEGHLFILESVSSRNSDHNKKWDLSEAPIEKSVTAERTDKTIVVVDFHRDAVGKQVLLTNDLGWSKKTYGVDEQLVARIKLGRPIDELRREALAASPPHEEGNFRKPELVELTTLDPAIHLDIRYATTNDFLGTPVYTQARAFLQRPAAESLVRALHKLQPLGYGLLIHDAYRPWYVTKIFWDATPPEGKIFVADPSQGSRHNRGCAADLTLYDLATGKPIEMPGTYDEMSPRSFPDYPGGTSLQRWHRDLLRRAMESEGFTVYEHEWWHFDYKDWHEYPILNIKFEDLHSGQGLASAQ
jgi:D-alanyl-D-alanine dipeptidase